MNKVLLGFVLSTFAGLSTLIGFLVVIITKKKTDKLIIGALAFAAGVMFFLSITDLIVEAINFINYNFYKTPSILICFIFLVIGIIISIFIDKLFPNNINDTKNKKLYKVGLISMLAIIIHNIPEGIATFVTVSENLKLGFSIAFAITLHNIPEGISISLPIYYATNNRKKAFLYTLISGLSEPFGALLAFLFLAPIMTKLMLGILFAIIAGIMLYISLYELLPFSFKYKNNKLTILFFILGIIFVLINHFIF